MAVSTALALMVYYSENSSIWPQVFAAAVVCLGPLASGFGKGYSSPALASLQDSRMPIVTVPGTSIHTLSLGNYSHADGHRDDGPKLRSPLFVSPQEASWIASLSLLGALFGDIFAGVALNLGRRRIMVIIAIPFAASWMMTVFAEHVAVICVTSFIGGLCSAILTLSSQIYISEIANPEIRGLLCSLAKIMTNVGLLVCFVLGAYLDWRRLALVAGFMPIILLVLLSYIPESPSFLLFRGNETQALAALQWLRGRRACVYGEMDAMKENLLSPHQRSIDSCDRGTLWARCQALAHPVTVTCTMMLFQRCTGAFVLNYYAVVIFKYAVGSLSPHNVAIMQASVQLASSLVFGLLVDRIGRKPLLIGGNVVISLSLAGLAWCFQAQEAHLDWFPITCIILFTVAYSLGIGPIALLLVSELYPIEFRGFGGAMATSFSHACGFVIVKTFVDFQGVLNLSGTFLMYSVLSLLAVFFIVFFVPETKGKTLEDIQRQMRRPLRT